MSHQVRGLRWQTDGRAGKAIPPQSGIKACIHKEHPQRGGSGLCQMLTKSDTEEWDSMICRHPQS